MPSFLVVTDASIESDGFRFIVGELDAPLGWLRYVPERFSDFLDYMEKNGIPRAVIFASDFERTRRGLRIFRDWLTKECTAEFERDIRAGHLTFEEVREIQPLVFDVPAFQRFHAQLFKAHCLPKGRKGKRTKYRPKVEELYALACRIYRETPGLSWESACYSATERRPDLVPKSWLADAGGNLKRDAARYWDKSRYSQLSFRQSRDR